MVSPRVVIEKTVRPSSRRGSLLQSALRREGLPDRTLGGMTLLPVPVGHGSLVMVESSIHFFVRSIVGPLGIMRMRETFRGHGKLIR